MNIDRARDEACWGPGVRLRKRHQKKSWATETIVCVGNRIATANSKTKPIFVAQ
jgi:hypothetical protein